MGVSCQRDAIAQISATSILKLITRPGIDPVQTLVD